MTTRQPNFQNQRNSNFYTGYQKRANVNPNESLDLFASVDQSRISQTPKMNFDPNQSAMNSFTVSPIRQPGNPAMWNQGHDDSLNTSMFNSPHFGNNPTNQRMSNNNQRASARSNFHPQHQPQHQQQQMHQQRMTNYNQQRTLPPANLNVKNPPAPVNGHYNAESTYNNSGGGQPWKKVDNQPFEIMELYSQDSQSNGLETESGGFYNGNQAVGGRGDVQPQNAFVKKQKVGYGGQGGGGTLGSRFKNYADLNGYGEEQKTLGGQSIQRSSEGFCGKDDCCLI